MSSRGLTVHFDQRNDSDAFLDLTVLEKMRPTLQKIATTPSEYFEIVPRLLIAQGTGGRTKARNGSKLLHCYGYV